MAETRNPTLSLVVPVYNVAPFLPQCLDSLKALNPAADEIIAVDDGSTDECAAILARYALDWPELRLVRQENRGLSEARNTGMRHATGRYVAFVDADDFVAPDTYGPLVAMCERDRLDMALSNAWYHFEGRQPDYPIYRGLSDGGVVSGARWMKERLEQRRFLHMVWLHVYRRDFLREHGFGFVPGLIHEDVIWTTRALLLAARVRCDPEPRYRYRIRVRRYTPEQNDMRLSKIIDGAVYNAQALASLAQEAADPELASLIRWQLVDGGLSVFHKLEKLSAGARASQIANLRRQDYFRLLWDSATGWRQKRKVARHYLKSWLHGGK